MKKILITIPLSQKGQQDFDSLAKSFGYAVVFQEAARLRPEELADCEIILGAPSPSLLREAKALRFLHLSMSGADAYVKPGVLPREILLTNSTGAFGHAISEHLLGMLFELYKKLHLYRDNQNAALWRDEGNVRSIRGASCLVVGLGDIGSCFAKTASALGMRVSGMRRTVQPTPGSIEAMYPFDTLSDCIGQFDVVVLTLPETPETHHLMNRTMLSAMKDGAILLNVGRGTAIDTDALVEALNSGKLSGAGLDVTEPEPLPPEHPLWKCRNCVITPHVSGYFHLQETYDSIVQLAYDNLTLYLQGKPVNNQVDFDTGYRKVESSVAVPTECL